MYLFELVFLVFFSGIYPGVELLGHMVDLDSIPGLRRFPGEVNGNPLWYSCLESSMARGAWAGYSPESRKKLDMTK